MRLSANDSISGSTGAFIGPEVISPPEYTLFKFKWFLERKSIDYFFHKLLISPRYNNHDPKPLSRKTQGLFHVWRWALCYSAPSLSLLPSYFKAQLRRKETALWTFGPKSSKKLAPSWWKSSSASLKKWKTAIEQNTLKRRFYVVPPLNAQYEEVQPDLHSLERYDFSKMPDLPWYP